MLLIAFERRLLLQHGADPNSTNLKQQAALHVCALEKVDTQVLDQRLMSRVQSAGSITAELLKYNADVNLVDLDGEPPLLLASRCGAIDLVTQFDHYRS